MFKSPSIQASHIAMIATSSLWTCQSQPGNYVRKGAVYQGTGLIQGGGSDSCFRAEDCWKNKVIKSICFHPCQVANKRQGFQNCDVHHPCWIVFCHTQVSTERGPQDDPWNLLFGLGPSEMQSFGVESHWETLDAAQWSHFFSVRWDVLYTLPKILLV